MKADIDLIKQAASMLDKTAVEILQSHNLNWRNPSWDGEPEAKAEFDAHKDTSTKLYALANRMQQEADRKTYGASVLSAFDRLDRESVRERQDRRAVVERNAKDRL